jgi:superfamily I DNA and/or RNA helicase
MNKERLIENLHKEKHSACYPDNPALVQFRARLVTSVTYQNNSELKMKSPN